MVSWVAGGVKKVFIKRALRIERARISKFLRVGVGKRQRSANCYIYCESWAWFLGKSQKPEAENQELGRLPIVFLDSKTGKYTLTATQTMFHKTHGKAKKTLWSPAFISLKHVLILSLFLFFFFFPLRLYIFKYVLVPWFIKICN